MLSLTPTKLQDFLTCPRKFKYKHIDKIGGISSSAAFSFGSTMHRVLQEIHSSKQKPVELPDVRKMLKRFWESSAYTVEEEGEYFTRAVKYCIYGMNKRYLTDEANF